MTNLIDKSKAFTAEDLIRRYNLNGLKTDRSNISKIKDSLTKQFNIIKDFIIFTRPYKNQTDKLTVWFLTGIPTLESDPFINFSGFEKDEAHLYYDKSTGKTYKLSNKESGYSWEEIDDIELKKSLAIANSESDTIDGRRVIFFSVPTTPYQIGDVWLDGNQIMRCRCAREAGNYSEIDWIDQDGYSNDFVLADTKAVLNDFKKEVTETYVSHTQLETTQDSILATVSSETTRIESISQSNYTDLSNKLNNYETIENVNLVKQQVSGLMTSTDYAIKVVEDIQLNGVSQVRTENNFTFNKDGLNIDEVGSKAKNLLNNNGMTIIDKSGRENNVLFFAGYDEDTGASIVSSKNIYVEQYFTIGKHSRFEDYIDEDGNAGTGCYILEGN